ncbi:MAG: Gmad2 immunoglobulin-like domain-containing protein [Peptococcia bacterium]
MKKLSLMIMVLLISAGLLMACGNVGQGPGVNLSPTPDTEEDLYEVVLYFSDNDLMNIYRVKTQITVEKEEDLPKAALEAWIAGPEHEELSGIIPANVIVEYVEDVDGVAHVSFSKEIQEMNTGSTGEVMIAEQLALIMEQFGFKSTQILVEGKTGDALFGHLYTADPIIAGKPETYQWIDEKEPEKIILQNMAFKIFEPVPNSEVKDRVIVRGLARVFEGTIQYEFEDGHFILDQGFTTASKGAPEWGEFEIIIELDQKTANGRGTVVLYEESAKDGSRLHELQIPVVIKE